MDENADSEHAPQQPRKSRTEHLRPHMWQKGTSGNPGGRKRTQPFSEELRRALDENGGARLRQIVELYLQDLETSAAARARIGPELLNRYEGKVMDELNVTGSLETKTLILPAEGAGADSDCQSPPATAGAPPPDNEIDGKVKDPNPMPLED